MFRNKLSKWRAVAFRNVENRIFSTKRNSCSFTTLSKQTSVLGLSNRTKQMSASHVGLKESRFSSLNKYHRLYSTTKKLPEHEVILMPALSPTMTVGNIGTFHKKVGDPIQPGDLLCEIETDKAQMDFEVQEEGFLAKILMPEGTKDAEVGKPLAVFVSKKEDIEAFNDFVPEDGKTEQESKAVEAPTSTKESKATTDEVVPSTSSVYIDTNDSTCQIKEDLSKPIHHNNHEETTTPADESNGNRVIASPLAKKLASELGVNLNGITGSGPNGRIIKDDIISAGVEKFKGNTQSQASSQSKFTDLPLSSMRKVIASRLTESKQSIPHYYLKVEVEMDRILELRAKFNSNDLLQESFGTFKLSVNDFIVKAAALALKKVPECNSSWQGEFIRQHENVDICVAVATPAGLITPIIPDSDLKGLVAISGTVKELAQRAKINKLKPHEYQGGTFTISNLGMYGVESFTAIINPPQSCILAVGATNPKVVVNSDGSGTFTTSQIMAVTLSCDHRVVDGATGAQWLKHFKHFLEEPEQMIL